MTAAQLQIKLMGHLEVRLEGEVVIGYRSRRTKWLMGFLALQNGAVVEYETLAARLWPDSPPENMRMGVPQTADSRRSVSSQALASVRQSVNNLVDLLGADHVRGGGRGLVQLSLSDAWVDVFAFDAAIAKGHPNALQEAVDLYTGDLLPDCPAEWAEIARVKRRLAYQQTLRTLAAEAAVRLDYTSAEECLRLLIASDPRKEKPRCDLMLLLARQGEYLAALEVYDKWRASLGDPHLVVGEEMRAIHRSIRARVSVSVAHSSSASLSETATASKPLYHLPHPVEKMIGREETLAEIRASVLFARLVTLQGPPGVGKTQLAIHAAQTMREEFPGGAVFIDLTEVTEMETFYQRLAVVLRIAEPASPKWSAAVDLLRRRRFLLILDNCEQITRRGSGLVRALLEDCPYLHILTTSRNAWRQNLGEKVLMIPPLTLPLGTLRDRSADALIRLLPKYTAVSLFVSEAANIQSDFLLTPANAYTIVQICRRLDGLPLAIRLLASWARTLSPAQMLSSLEEGMELLRMPESGYSRRHSTLIGAVEVSYSLLDPSMQRFFRRLAVFQGGWSHEAAEAVCDEPQALEYLRELQERSLVISAESEQARRFSFLETIRRFARQKSQPAEAEAMRLQHLRYYRQFVRTMEGANVGSPQAIWLDRLECERANLNAALEEAERQDAYEAGLELACVLRSLWYVHGSDEAGISRLERLLQKSDSIPERNGGVPAPLRAKALNAAGSLALQRTDYPRAQKFYSERLTVLEQMKETGALKSAGEAAEIRRGLAGTLGNLANIASYRKDLQRARTLFQQSLTYFQTLEDMRGIALTEGNLAIVACSEDNLSQALVHHENCVDALRRLGDAMHLALSLTNMAFTQVLCKDYLSAVRSLREGLSISQSLGDKENLARILYIALALAVNADRRKEAAALLGMAEAWSKRCGLPLHANAASQHERDRNLLQAHLGTEDFNAAITQAGELADGEILEHVSAFFNQGWSAPNSPVPTPTQ